MATQGLTAPMLPFIPQLKTGQRVEFRSRTDALNACKRPCGLALLSYLSQISASYFENLAIVTRQAIRYTELVQDFQNARLTTMSLPTLIDYRNAIQHAAMSLPTGAEIEAELNALIEPEYEACRLSLIIYNLINVFPLPLSTAPFAELASLLRKESLSGTLLVSGTSDSDLVLWLIVMGTLAAASSPMDRAWYISALSQLMLVRELESWAQMKRILLDHLWSESPSDIDGLAVWQEATKHWKDTSPLLPGTQQ